MEKKLVSDMKENLMLKLWKVCLRILKELFVSEIKDIFLGESVGCLLRKIGGSVIVQEKIGVHLFCRQNRKNIFGDWFWKYCCD